jgi:3-hydroxyisobutyrate dehydrogenase
VSADKAVVGFVGIGVMGTPMAANLARAGYRVVAYDLAPERTRALAQAAQVEVAPDPAAVGRAAAIVITMLPDGAAVRRALCGEADGFRGCVAGTLAAGSLVIDMSSSSPLGTRELGPVLAARGIALVDAPVSGGVRRARDASLAIMAGGEAAAIERARPVLACLGTHIFHAGPLGAGHAAKALNNYVSAAGLVAACEAVVAAQRFGLDPNTLVDILNASTGMNNSTQNKLRQFILSGSFDAGFTLGLMAKDLRTALEVARATSTPTPLAAPCIDLWNRAEQALGGQADHTAVYRLIDRE